MKKKITAIILTVFMLATLGGATALAAGNGRHGNQGQADGTPKYTETVTGTCTGVLSRTLDRCIYNHYNECNNYSECRNSGTCICNGGTHTFTDQDKDGICDYRNSADGYQNRSGQYSSEKYCTGSGHHGTGSGGHHGNYSCR